ncbi:MAG: hypothetical protein QOH05_877, partial [Acetobacteraceae bacterium]|nr:hypothetical protein [Acetobacteraceae bacterium]
SVLDAGTVGQYHTQLASIGSALQPGGSLLLYGCDVAQDEAGVAFVDQLSAATGGSNIAAASHLVGAADQGGSFTLDVNVGQVAAPTPFTAQTQADFAGVLPTAINQLFFAVSNNVPTAPVNRVNQIGVSGATTIGTAVDLVDGSQALFGNGTTVISLPGVAVDPAAGKFFFTDTNSNATFNRIYEGSIASPGGTLTTIFSTPITTTQLQGLAIDQPNGNLYFALNASTAGSIGIYEVSESGGTATKVVSGFTSAAHALFQIALDVPDNLVFFADSPGLTSVSTLWVGNLLSHTETALATSTKGSRLEGVAFNNGTVYWSTINGGTIANNGIFSAPVTITGSGSLASATLGTTSTLYAGKATGNGTIANTPISLAVDPVTGILYSGSNIVSGGTYQAIINAGTVTGGSSMTTIFSSAFAGTSASAPPTVALTLESTPTVAASGSVDYIIGGSSITVDSTASVSNPSGFNLASATIAITGGTFTNDGDTLTATTAGTGITATFSNETLTLSGNDTLAHYKQVMDSVAFASTAADPGNAGANLTRTVSWTVSDGLISSTTPTSTIKIHSTPVITAGGTVSFTGGGSATTLDPSLTVSDAYSSTISSATISVGSFVSGDLMNFTTQNGITGSYASETGTLTLSGTASVANYQSALESITYSFNPSNGDPTAGGGNTTRTVSWIVNDGVVASSAASSSLNVIHAAPTITASGTVTYGGGAGPTVLDPAAVVVAPDSANLLTSAMITVSAGSFTGDGDVLSADITGTTILASYDSTSEILTLTGTDTATDYQQVLRSVTIDSSGADPTGGGLHPTRTFSWQVNDGVANSAASTSAAYATLCFCAGTLILTPAGEVPVERLTRGDLVLTERGEARRIEWLGNGRVLATRRRRNAATPVIICKGALADNVPRRDLRVTKGHGFHLDGVLIPVEFLVNYRSIIWDDHAQEVQLYHIELETHDVLVANGAPAESYRDDGNRWLFRNANESWNLPPKEPCAPVLTGGPLVDAVWQRLLKRTGTRPNFPVTDDPNLHLIVNGETVNATRRRDGSHVFALKHRPETVSIVSRDAVPAELGLARDFRSLGVAVKQIIVRQSARERTLQADDERLTDGFHPFEPHNGFRWTNGAATVPSALFADFEGPTELVMAVAGTTQYVDDGETRMGLPPQLCPGSSPSSVPVRLSGRF